MLNINKYEYDQHFHLEEIFTLVFLTIINILILVYADFRKAWVLFFINLVLIFLINVVAFINSRYRPPWFVGFRDIYIVFISGFLFFEHHHLIPLINPHDVDIWLIRVDRFLFLGNDPTVLLERVSFPAIIEFLQVVYTSYYLLPLSLILLLYFKGRKTDFHIAAPTIMLGLYICYLGYYVSPAIGPRFTLDHLQVAPLKGVFAFDYIRNLIDTFEGVTRDCCPSGHTLVSVLSAMLAFKYYRPVYRYFFIWAALIVVSTVFLRYHYVIDVIAGLVIAFAVFRFSPVLMSRYICKIGDLKETDDLATEEA